MPFHSTLQDPGYNKSKQKSSVTFKCHNTYSSMSYCTALLNLSGTGFVPGQGISWELYVHHLVQSFKTKMEFDYNISRVLRADFQSYPKQNCILLRPLISVYLGRCISVLKWHRNIRKTLLAQWFMYSSCLFHTHWSTICLGGPTTEHRGYNLLFCCL